MMGVGDSIFVRMIPYILTLALSLGEHSKKRGQRRKFKLINIISVQASSAASHRSYSPSLLAKLMGLTNYGSLTPPVPRAENEQSPRPPSTPPTWRRTNSPPMQWAASTRTTAAFVTVRCSAASSAPRSFTRGPLSRGLSIRKPRISPARSQQRLPRTGGPAALRMLGRRAYPGQ